MDLSGVFPRLQAKHLPDILTRILLHVSYTDDLRHLSLVSRGWRDFFDRVILAIPNARQRLREKLIHAWTKRKPARRSMISFATTSNNLTVRTSGDYVFVAGKDAQYETLVYKNLELVGSILSTTPSAHRFVVYREHFLDLHNYYYPSHDDLRLKVYSKQEDSTFLSRELASPVSLKGKNILGLQSIGDAKLLLVCLEADSGNVVIVNMVNWSDQIISPPAGLLPSFRSLKQSLKAMKGVVDSKVLIASDGREISIFWKKENCLQLIDHERGQETWNTYGVLAHSEDGHYPYPLSLVKSVRLTCLRSRTSNGVEIRCFSNRTGHLVNRFSMGRSCNKTLPVAYYLIWQSWERGKMQFNVADARGLNTTLPNPALPSCGTSECPSGCCIQFDIVDVILDRLVLLGVRCSNSNSSYLVAYDMHKEKMVVLDEQNSCHYSYVSNVPRGELFCYSSIDKSATVLDFYKTRRD